MSELEMKELENADLNEISGGRFSLDDLKKWAKKHKKVLMIGGTAVSVGTIVAVEELGFKGKHRKKVIRFLKGDKKDVTPSSDLGEAHFDSDDDDYVELEVDEDGFVVDEDGEKWEVF